jgi:hypothetical protein
MQEQSPQNPAERILSIGEPNIQSGATWLDYTALGIGSEHIPALIRIATDMHLLTDPDERNPRGWAPVHAWRALGQLGADEAIQPLIALFHQVKDNDWVIEELPDVFALIGPPAVDCLIVYLKDLSYPDYARMVAATCLMEIGRAYSAAHLRCASALAEQLDNFESNHPSVNGILVANLVELNAVEYRSLIHKVFSEGHVDRFIAGDWRDVKKLLLKREPASDDSSANITTETTEDSSRLRINVKRVPPNPASGGGNGSGDGAQASDNARGTRATSEPNTRPQSPRF